MTGLALGAAAPGAVRGDPRQVREAATTAANAAPTAQHANGHAEKGEQKNRHCKHKRKQQFNHGRRRTSAAKVIEQEIVFLDAKLL